MVIHKIVPITA